MATNSKAKTPPKFDSGMDYAVWKNKLEMWQVLNTGAIDKKNQALFIRLYCFENNDKAEKAVSNLKTADLNVDTGVNVLIQKLDTVFELDKRNKANKVFSNFIYYDRPEGMAIEDFIVEYDQRYEKMKEHDMNLPDGVLTFRLLDAAKLSSEERKLALAVGKDVEFESMKSALKRVFSKLPSSFSSNIDIKTEIKTEEQALYMKKRNFKNNANKQYKYYTKESKARSYEYGKPNPINDKGETTKCLKCKSELHYIDDCQHNNKARFVNMNNLDETSDSSSDGDGLEEANVVLLTLEKINKNEIFLAEALKAAVVDTACTKTVTGNDWFLNYCENLPDKFKNEVVVHPSKTAFKFGDGKTVYAEKKAIIPVVVAGLKAKVETEIVREKIPLLLSKSSLKRAEMVIDMKNDKATIFNRPVELQLSSSGHYCINICPTQTSETTEQVLVNVLDCTLPRSKRCKKVKKLHEQFSHASENQMVKMLERAGMMDKELHDIVNEVIRNCNTCVKFKRAVPKPVVGLPKAHSFNITVSMDLHNLVPNKVWYLHMVDEFTRFSNAIIIRNKKMAYRGFLLSWISLFGPPSSMFSDNGGEFIGSEMVELCNSFGIKMTNTPSYSPWSNGLCERHNSVLTDMVLKTKEHTKCDWETALAWSICSKNSLINNKGFSSSQLVFGENGNYPSVFNSGLAALETLPNDSPIGLHIAALHAARKNFMAADASERIKRALRSNIRKPYQDHYEIGQYVYYWREHDSDNSKSHWRGPAKVIGQDGQVMILRHGTYIVKAHLFRVSPCNSIDENHYDSLSDSTNDKNDNLNDHTSSK